MNHLDQSVRGTTAFLLIVMLVVLFGTSPAFATDTSGRTPEGVGLQAASWLLTIPYGAVKVAYALGGGIVGGLAWAITGGSTKTAEAIWVPSMTGDYLVLPQHLTGEKAIHFVGTTGGVGDGSYG